jgi:hypothetical protein
MLLTYLINKREYKMSSTTAQAIAKIQKQMEELQKEQEELLNAGKDKAIIDINKILNDNGYSIIDLFPEFKKGFKGVRVKTNVKIGLTELEISGKITKDIQEALRIIGKNPDDYDKKKVIDEFSV